MRISVMPLCDARKEDKETTSTPNSQRGPGEMVQAYPKDIFAHSKTHSLEEYTKPVTGAMEGQCMNSFIPENNTGQVGGIMKPGDAAQHVPKWDLFGKFYSKRDHEFGALECPTAAVLTQI